MNQRANIRNVNSHVFKDYHMRVHVYSKITCILNPKKDNLESGFLKPEYPFKLEIVNSLFEDKRIVSLSFPIQTMR